MVRSLVHLNLWVLGALLVVVVPLVVVAVQAIMRWAPEAEGSGIPQVIVAAKHLGARRPAELLRLVSGSTMLIKGLALLLALAAGASTGREGPTVHIAACLFVVVASLLARVCGLEDRTGFRHAAGEMRVNVLDRHRGLVDENPDGKRQPTERHDVDRLTGAPQRDHAGQQRERDRDNDDAGAAPIAGSWRSRL